MFLRPRHRLRTPPLRSFVKIIGVGSGYSRLMIQCACLTQSTLSIEKCNMSSSNTYIYYHFCKYCNIEKLKIRDVPLRRLQGRRSRLTLLQRFAGALCPASFSSTIFIRWICFSCTRVGSLRFVN